MPPYPCVDPRIVWANARLGFNSMASVNSFDLTRWVPSRKAQVVAAVRGGLLSLEEVCDRYSLTVEEFLSWQQSVRSHRALLLISVPGRDR